MKSNITIISCANATSGIGRYSQEIHAAFLTKNLDSFYFSREKTNLPHSRAYPFLAPKSFRNKLGPHFLKFAIRNHQSDFWLADYVDSGSILGKKQTSAKRIITTVHDGIPFLFPKNESSFKTYVSQLELCSKNSDFLIVVSNCSKNDLLNFTKIPEEKIKVVYNGINHRVFNFSGKKIENSAFTIRYHGGLSMGHKNTQLLLYMAKILEERSIDFKLELAGAHPNSTPLPKMAAQMGLKKVHFVGYLPDSEIQSFLNQADLYVYPSKYEGFGFTPLEAMACGAPVISSNGGSLSEVLGNSAHLVEPEAEAFAEAVILLQNDIQRRNELSLSGLYHVKKYNWETCAQETLQLFHI